MQQAIRVSATTVSYPRSKLVKKMEKSLTIWVENMNRKTLLWHKQIFRIFVERWIEVDDK